MCSNYWVYNTLEMWLMCETFTILYYRPLFCFIFPWAWLLHREVITELLYFIMQDNRTKHHWNHVLLDLRGKRFQQVQRGLLHQCFSPFSKIQQIQCPHTLSLLLSARDDGLLYCSVCQRADGHESEPCPSTHTNTHAPAVCVVKGCVVRWKWKSRVQCWSLALTSHTLTHTRRLCVPGQVSAAQSRLYPSSHHMDRYWSQNTEREAGMDGRRGGSGEKDGGMK